MSKKREPKKITTVKALRTVTKEEWDKKLSLKPILSVYRRFDAEENRKMFCTDEFISFMKDICTSANSKKGNLIEDIMFRIISSDDRFEMLSSCCDEDGKHLKNANIIHLPGCIRDYINSRVIKGFKTYEELKDFYAELRVKVLKAKAGGVTYAPFDTKQDLDLGFIDKETGVVYLVEVKKSGSFGADVAARHLQKFFYAYANYLYNCKENSPEIVNTMLFVERGNQTFNFLPRTNMGYQTLDEFLTMVGSEFNSYEVLKTLREETQLDDVLFSEIKLRMDAILRRNPKLRGASATVLHRAFTNTYSAWCDEKGLN